PFGQMVRQKPAHRVERLLAIELGQRAVARAVLAGGPAEPVEKYLRPGRSRGAHPGKKRLQQVKVLLLAHRPKPKHGHHPAPEGGAISRLEFAERRLQRTDVADERQAGSELAEIPKR